MTLVDQTILASDPHRQGNCLSACVATYLGLPLDQVPHWAEYQPDDGLAWWHHWLGFMAGRGLWPLELDDPGDAEPGEVTFVCGPSERGVLHQVLYRDGRLFHDPHPSRAGLLAVTEVLVWRPVTHDHRPSVLWDVCPWHPNSPEAVARRHRHHLDTQENR